MKKVFLCVVFFVGLLFISPLIFFGFNDFLLRPYERSTHIFMGIIGLLCVFISVKKIFFPAVQIVSEQQAQIFKKIGKMVRWIFVVVVVSMTIISAFGYLGPRIYTYILEKRGEYYDRKRVEFYTNDTDGGKTPEETFDMFLDALKKGDIERASKYYELGVQERALNGLKTELKDKGNLELSIKFFSDVRGGEKGCQNIDKSYGGCNFEYIHIYKEETKVPISGTNNFILVPKGRTARQITDFELNHYSNTWKITQPY